MSNESLSRRLFLMGGTAALAAPALPARMSLPERVSHKSLNEKLNIAGIGIGGKGRSDLAGCAGENIVALADPDWDYAARTFAKYPKAAKYKDFRQMLDKETGLDAVIIATPDHNHAITALHCMERGLGVYVQKPMAHSVTEARAMLAAARKYGVATQMGNQGHSNDGARRACEIIWSGAIGDVREVHAWTNRPIWPQGIDALLPEQPVPATMDWDVWLGPAEERPYNIGYAPFKWRGWFDYGCGALGDMACHILDPSNWALQLHAPTSVEVVSQEKDNKYTFPTKSVIRFEFPARGSMPPVTLYWYDGGNLPPRQAGLGPDVKLGDPKDGRNGSLFVGDKGFLTTGTYGEHTRLVPDDKMADYKMPPEVLSRSPGHYQDWIRACKGGAPACSNFEYAAPFTEWVLLGVSALRAGHKLEWDSKAMKFSNDKTADDTLKWHRRKGWKA
ncbi:MAG: Gfo/Idh/MocA family oxidoreductase [Bryobacteraceae bacterium]